MLSAEDIQTDEPGERMFLERFKKAAKSHIGDANLRMDDLGSELSLSKVQMYRKVKALTGKTPAEVLREMRMQKAYSLLKQGGLRYSRLLLCLFQEAVRYQPDRVERLTGLLLLPCESNLC